MKVADAPRVTGVLGEGLVSMKADGTLAVTGWAVEGGRGLPGNVAVLDAIVSLLQERRADMVAEPSDAAISVFIEPSLRR